MRSGGDTPPVWQSAVAGGIAGGVADFTVHPVDTAKTILQANAVKGHSGAAALKEALVSSGTRRVYAGGLSMLVGAIPANMAYFGGYEVAKNAILARMGAEAGDDSAVATLAHVGGAMVGEVSCALILTPFDIIKQRRQLHGTAHYRSVADGFKSLWYTHATPSVEGIEGGCVRAAARPTISQGLAGVYTGFGATLFRDVPYAVVQFVLYERIRGFMAARNARKGLGGDVGLLSDPEAALAGCMAGGAAAAATNPMDVVKTRLQTGGSDFGSIRATARDIAAREGLKAFSKGITARVAWMAPNSAIAFLVYERARTFLAGSAASPAPPAAPSG